MVCHDVDCPLIDPMLGVKFCMIIIHRIQMNWKFMLETSSMSSRCATMVGIAACWKHPVILIRWHLEHFQATMFNYCQSKEFIHREAFFVNSDFQHVLYSARNIYIDIFAHIYVCVYFSLLRTLTAIFVLSVSSRCFLICEIIFTFRFCFLLLQKI